MEVYKNNGYDVVFTDDKMINVILKESKQYRIDLTPILNKCDSKPTVYIEANDNINVHRLYVEFGGLASRVSIYNVKDCHKLTLNNIESISLSICNIYHVYISSPHIFTLYISSCKLDILETKHYIQNLIVSNTSITILEVKYANYINLIGSHVNNSRVYTPLLDVENTTIISSTFILSDKGTDESLILKNIIHSYYDVNKVIINYMAKYVV